MDREQIIKSASAEDQVSSRYKLAVFTAEVFMDVGEKLHVIGHFVGGDRQTGVSPFGHGNDATVAVSMLLRIGSQLVSGTEKLMASGQHYAAAALIRQLVEVEYLAWAFEAQDQEAARWLRSTRDERRDFFSPAKLRKAAGTKFRSVDYSYHCELGGHPVPNSWALLNNNIVPAQIMLSDCLGHSGRIWDHIFRWARVNPTGIPVIEKSEEMLEKYTEWKSIDELTKLSSPPDFPSDW